MTDTRSYDSFGQIVASSGTSPTSLGFVANEGYEQDIDSGMVLVGHRYYDPSTGRFLTRDPTGAGRSWYVYVDSNPQGWVDPTGFQVLFGADPWWFFDGYPIFGEQPPVWYEQGVKFVDDSDLSSTAFWKHLKWVNDASRDIDEYREKLRSGGKRLNHWARQELDEKIQKRLKFKKGHVKEMDEKWPGWRGKDWSKGPPVRMIDARFIT